VAILDVDFHHGNGTQDIFYARGLAARPFLRLCAARSRVLKTACDRRALPALRLRAFWQDGSLAALTLHDARADLTTPLSPRLQRLDRASELLHRAYDRGDRAPAGESPRPCSHRA